jgi:hypothetical protein
MSSFTATNTTTKAIATTEVNAQSTLVPFMALYAVTIFLSAFLLFQVQLIIAKYILPWFGGSPSVWNSCLLLFQILLLAGYSYAHVLSTRLTMKSQARLHLALLLISLAVLAMMAYRWPSPITPGGFWKPAPNGSPVWQVICVLLAGVGFPFFILSSTGPLLQVWFSRTQEKSPYRFYALSNAGSMLGLLSYPFLVERFLRLRTQAWVWSISYCLFLLAYGACAWMLRKHRASAESVPIQGGEIPPKPKVTLLMTWLALAACASAMLLATTNLICQEIAVIPLLWVLPLCVYLLTFIICFDNERWYRRSIFHSLYALAFFVALSALSQAAGRHILVQIGVFSLVLFSVCMVCHGELVKGKPAREYLSTFYLMIAMGGALGSIFVVLIAPRIFRQFWEFQLSLLFCGVLLLTIVLRDQESWFYKQRVLRVLLGVIIIGIIVKGYDYRKTLIRLEGGAFVAFRDRNFFGIKIGLRDQVGNWLVHGQISHGAQLSDPALHDEPTLYYRRLSGIGLIVEHYPRSIDEAGKPRALRVGVIGLGAGTLAAYGHPGDYYRFYEIDPQVVSLSQGGQPWFTFLKDSPAKIDIVLGDARLSLEKEAARGDFQKFDVLVLDAFNGDSIPVHLLTTEAMALYLLHLRGPDSVIAFHLSNLALDLRPVADGLSREYHMASSEVDRPGVSDWVLTALNPHMMDLPELKERSKPVTVGHAVPLWTDEYSNLFDVLRSTQ